MLCDRANGIDHVHVTHRKKCDRVLPRGPAQELVQSRVLFRKVKYFRQLQVNKLGQFRLELVVWTQKSETNLLDQRQVLEQWILEKLKEMK